MVIVVVEVVVGMVVVGMVFIDNKCWDALVSAQPTGLDDRCAAEGVM